MTNAELINELRYCFVTHRTAIPWYVWCDRAADALETAEKRIAELERTLPIVETVKEDALMQRIMELEARLPKEGEWIEGTYNLAHNLYTCSVCGLAMITTPDYAEKHHYCYGCGAKNKVKWMKGEQE